MFTDFRAWLSIELINLGLKVCPFPTMEGYLRNAITLAVDSYLNQVNIDE